MAYAVIVTKMRGGVRVGVTDSNSGDRIYYEPVGGLRIQQHPSGSAEIFRVSGGDALCSFDVETGGLSGFDHDGDFDLLLSKIQEAFAAEYVLEDGGDSIAVGESSPAFDCRGLKDCIVFCSVFDIDETVTLRADISTTGEDGTWIAQANYAAKSNENFTLTLPVSPFVRLTFVSQTSNGAPTIDVTYYGVKA